MSQVERSRKGRFLFALLAFVVGSGLSVPAAGQGEGEAPDGEEQKSEESSESTAPSSKQELSEEKRQEYETHLQTGKQAYASGDPEKAFRNLKAAHDIYPKPSILFNLGLISEKQGNLERAAKYYREFVGSPGVDLEARKRGSERLSAVNQILKATDKEKTETQKTDLQPALEAMSTGAEETDPAEEGSGERETGTASREGDAAEGGSSESGEPAPGTASGQQGQTGAGPTPAAAGAGNPRPQVDYNWPIYLSYGSGVAFLSGGVVTLALTQDRTDKARKAGSESERSSLEQEASMYKTSTVALFAGGAGLAALGSYFVIRKSGQAASSSEKQARRDLSVDSLGVAVGPDGSSFGAHLSVDFD